VYTSLVLSSFSSHQRLSAIVQAMVQVKLFILSLNPIWLKLKIVASQGTRAGNHRRCSLVSRSCFGQVLNIAYRYLIRQTSELSKHSSRLRGPSPFPGVYAPASVRWRLRRKFPTTSPPNKNRQIRILSLTKVSKRDIICRPTRVWYSAFQMNSM
jgi:hypothetical protein